MGEEAPIDSVFISALDYQGRGVARHNGKVSFITNALPNEEVCFTVINSKKSFCEGETKEIIKASVNRITPKCEYYQRCGGCALQHTNNAAQLKFKQNLWLEQLQRFADIQPEIVDPPIEGKAWRYRSRCDLSVDYDISPVAVGFKARSSHQVVGVTHCAVLETVLAEILPKLPAFLTALLPEKVSGLSLNKGDKVCAVNVALKGEISTVAWEALVNDLSQKWQLWVNNQCIIGDADDLHYALEDYKVIIPFTPLDFTQVNHELNTQMVKCAIDYLGAVKEKEILELFSGLGNFSLPLARLGAKVQAVEGVQQMVTRAAKIAEKNRLRENISPFRADLFEAKRMGHVLTNASVWLMDPPRAGAQVVCEAMTKKIPKRLVYVSCNPATLARDAKILKNKGFRLVRGCVVNMFPQTAHIESINMFVRNESP